MKTTQTVPCDRCGGDGRISEPNDEVGGFVFGRTCPSCQGQGHVEVDATREMGQDEAFLYGCAVRYAIGRQTYAGKVVAQQLALALPRMRYEDRHLIERAIADAFAHGRVDPLTQDDWKAVQARITDLNRAGRP